MVLCIWICVHIICPCVHVFLNGYILVSVSLELMEE